MRLLLVATACVLLLACRSKAPAVTVPSHFPQPPIPSDAPVTAERVELGRHLFYDQRLSRSGHMSCATCHVQAHAFTDGRPRAIGDTGVAHPRSSMSLANVVYNSKLTWANPLFERLEAQLRVPMFGEDPIEMGLNGREGEVVALLRREAVYATQFPIAFPADADAFTVANLGRAIATFERTLISGDSPYDHYLQGDPHALSEPAQRGLHLFISERLECFHCHGGFNFTDSVNHGGARLEQAYHNTGLYNLAGGSYPADSLGVFESTRQAGDMGRFRAPTLRNIAVTAPYMHDGSIATLEGVLDHYAAGGRTILSGPNAGVGAANPNKSPFVAGFVLAPDERAAVIEFLKSLTDAAFLTNPRFSDPWPRNIDDPSRAVQ